MAEEVRLWPHVCALPDESVPLPREVEAEPLTGPGAVWHIWRREDTEALSRWLVEQAEKYEAEGEVEAQRAILAYAPICSVAEMQHAVHSQAFFLTKAELERCKRETGVEPWVFPQYDNEAVFIPAGCPHQVRNTRSCIKMALDFVSPEALRETAVLAREFAGMATEEKLQSGTMLLFGAAWACEQAAAV